MKIYRLGHFIHKILIVLCLLVGSVMEASAEPWPMISSLKITSCSQPECASFVSYINGPTVLVDAPPLLDQGTGTDVVLWGIHCEAGGNGVPFYGCMWRNDNAHRPTLTGICKTTSRYNYILTPDSTCSVTTGPYGAHYGAGPGAECALFGKPSIGKDVLYTPWGPISPQQVANSGNSMCVKALPPDVTCDVSVANGGVFDHGTVGQNELSIRKLQVSISCGANPRLTFIGGNSVVLGGGVSTELTMGSIILNRAEITSSLRTSAAKPGDYRSAVVLVASLN